MKVLFYINTLAKGGAERVITNLANQFAEDNHETVVVTSYYKNNEYKLSDKVQRIYLADYIGNKKNRISKNLSMIYNLRKIIKDIKPDIAVSFTKEPSVRLILATIDLNTKTVISVRNDPEVNYKGIINKIIANCLYPKADGCIFQTEDSKDYFPLKLQKKSKIIFNQVSSEFFEIERKDPKYIVSIGNLYTDKNQILQINAFEKIVKSHPDEKLLIYGDGDLRNKLKNIIENKGLSENVFLMGRTDNVGEVLANAKIFLLTSNHEGMPNALLEALAVGVPCISTDCPCGGPNSVIKSGINGFLIPVNDQYALEKKINSLISDEQLCMNISRNAKISSNIFKPYVVYTQWKDYFYSLIKL